MTATQTTLKGETMTTLHTECIGNGSLKEIEVIQLQDGTVEIMLSAGGCYGRIFRGTIEDARKEYRELKANA